jgi:hypothetical protein
MITIITVVNNFNLQHTDYVLISLNSIIFNFSQGFLTDVKYLRDREESSSDDDHESVTFILGGSFDESHTSSLVPTPAIQSSLIASPTNSLVPVTSSVNTLNVFRQSLANAPPLVHQGNSVER